jgi:hypothetical protein
MVKPWIHGARPNNQNWKKRIWTEFLASPDLEWSLIKNKKELRQAPSIFCPGNKFKQRGKERLREKSTSRLAIWLSVWIFNKLKKAKENILEYVTILNASPLTTWIIIAFLCMPIYLLCCLFTVTLQNMNFLYTQNWLLCSVAVTFAAVHWFTVT